jgi:hypothetical protein
VLLILLAFQGVLVLFLEMASRETSIILPIIKLNQTNPHLIPQESFHINIFTVESFSNRSRINSCSNFHFSSFPQNRNFPTFSTPSSDFIDFNFRENCLGLKCKHLIGFSLTELLGLFTCVCWKEFCSVELDADIRYRWSSKLLETPNLH